MKTRHWTENPFVAFDTETTGIDTTTARILQAAIVTDDPEGILREQDRVIYIDPGCEIPAEASAIHGLTREKLRELRAHEPQTGIPTICGYLHGRSVMRGYPLVIYNACYDIPLLLAEVARLTDFTPPVVTPLFLDPLVIDRALDKYRKGSRKLEDVAAHYRVKLDGSAHDACTDARAALGIMRALVKAFPQLKSFDLQALQGMQARWYGEWRDGINSYWERSGKSDRVTGEWPGCRAEASNAA